MLPVPLGNAHLGVDWPAAIQHHTSVEFDDKTHLLAGRSLIRRQPGTDGEAQAGAWSDFLGKGDAHGGGGRRDERRQGAETPGLGQVGGQKAQAHREARVLDLDPFAYPQGDQRKLHLPDLHRLAAGASSTLSRGARAESEQCQAQVDERPRTQRVGARRNPRPRTDRSLGAGSGTAPQSRSRGASREAAAVRGDPCSREGSIQVRPSSSSQS